MNVFRKLNLKIADWCFVDSKNYDLNTDTILCTNIYVLQVIALLCPGTDNSLQEIIHFYPKLFFFFTIPILLNYSRYNAVKNTWLQFHFNWQIRTFWYSFVYSFGILLLFLPYLYIFEVDKGLEKFFNFFYFLFLILLYLFPIYRILKGFAVLKKDKKINKTQLMILKNNTYYNEYKIIIDWFIDSINNIDKLSQSDVCQLLLCAKDLELNSRSIQDKLISIRTLNDPPNEQNKHIVLSFLRQVVLMRYGIAEKDRKDFFQYWINENNISGKPIITVAYIIILAIEQIDLIKEKYRGYVKTWFFKHNRIESLKVRAWIPHIFNSLGDSRKARTYAEELLNERNKNGSWQGGLILLLLFYMD